ncbi:TetR family transcriptional regulator [Alkalihalobacillus alcalophilus ATCC 27647 = CGMCC 1.3604]|uniref:TetR family transcriptional regulator n=2 Tax=Alkalihalobacillus alcalophilus TaxID=1445 RepID=A0A4S4JXR7_ALKAL|nr:TetR/AcrR family transcriptional regulator [Alkalihalobacillus alcalophilus]MED1561963.1 TetR/AcrR family transcriptional regulator [Alkalihalobacillus alcalophilus]THG89550.1 TetR family transcriptional regulator [Alkalihalobacillus alcalophilus ATCC 27647 = CGMCC 1.3604]
MNGFERRKEQKKKNILEASLALFKEYGIQKVSIAEIAQKANVSQVTIYNYFESKDNLVQHVFKYYVDLVWEEQKALFDLDLPFKEKIKRMMFEKSDLADEIGEKFFQDFMLDYSNGKSYVEELYIKEGLPRLIELFNVGKEQGHIDQSISNEAMLLYLQMFKEFMQRKDIAQTLLPLTEDLTKLFFYGIVGEKDR